VIEIAFGANPLKDVILTEANRFAERIGLRIEGSRYPSPQSRFLHTFTNFPCNFPYNLR